MLFSVTASLGLFLFWFLLIRAMIQKHFVLIYLELATVSFFALGDGVVHRTNARSAFVF